MRRVLHFWVYTRQEVHEVLVGLAKRFNVRDFFHDTENVWEYAEGKSKSLNAFINVSREHDWKDYLPEEKPLLISIIHKKTTKRSTDIHKLGAKLQRHFKATVHHGKIRNTEGSSYEFICHQTFPETQLH